MIFVTPDVEYNTVIVQDTGVEIALLELSQCIPLCFSNFQIRCFKRLLGVRVALPKVSERFLSDYPHCKSYMLLLHDVIRCSHSLSK